MSAFDQLKIRYAEQRRVYGLSRNLEMNEDGVITLGAGILREFPSEYLDVSVDKVLQDANSGIPAARKAKKLLFDNRFRK